MTHAVPFVGKPPASGAICPFCASPLRGLSWKVAAPGTWVMVHQMGEPSRSGGSLRNPIYLFC